MIRSLNVSRVSRHAGISLSAVQWDPPDCRRVSRHCGMLGSATPHSSGTRERCLMLRDHDYGGGRSIALRGSGLQDSSSRRGRSLGRGHRSDFAGRPYYTCHVFAQRCVGWRRNSQWLNDSISRDMIFLLIVAKSLNRLACKVAAVCPAFFK